MRADGLMGTNGFSQVSNGPAARKASLNSPATAPVNREGHGAGSGKGHATSTYNGHDREEVTRILIQSLYELGYTGSADKLTEESGYRLETSGVATFRSAVLGGHWSDAEKILVASFRSTGQAIQRAAAEEMLVLSEDANRSEMLFYLRQQKFLELLQNGDLGAALNVLRQELTPLNYDIDRLHALSR